MSLSTSRPDFTTEDPATKRARILAALDIERANGTGRFGRPDPLDELARRMERIEAVLYSLFDRLEDAENLAAQGAEAA